MQDGVDAAIYNIVGEAVALGALHPDQLPLYHQWLTDERDDRGQTEQDRNGGEERIEGDGRRPLRAVINDRVLGRLDQHRDLASDARLTSAG